MTSTTTEGIITVGIIGKVGGAGALTAAASSAAREGPEEVVSSASAIRIDTATSITFMSPIIMSPVPVPRPPNVLSLVITNLTMTLPHGFGIGEVYLRKCLRPVPPRPSIATMRRVVRVATIG